MRTEAWLNLFREYSDTKIFYFEHFKLLTGMNNHTLRVNLSRIVRKKIIKRILRGYYSNPFNPPTLEEISSQIYQPSYISLESALSYTGILSQIPQILTCVTTRLPRIFKTSFGTIIYHQIKKELFWGFEKKDGYFLGEKEKALLDWLYWHKKSHNSLPPLDELDFSEINKRKLMKYSQSFPEIIRKAVKKIEGGERKIGQSFVA